MTKALFRSLLGLWLLAGCAAAARAADDTPQPYIVLVGIDKFTDPQILPRQHAEADAQALYDLFTSKSHLGVEAKHVRLLLGSADEKRHSEPATHDNILKALTWAATKAGRDDMVIFAYFGQGAPLGERTVFFGSDSTFKNRAKDAVAAAAIEVI